MPLAAAVLMLGRKAARPAPDRSDVNGRKPAQAGFRLPGNSCSDSAEQTTQQRDQGGADQGNTAAGHQLCYPQFVGTGPFFPDFMRGCIPLEINGFIPDQV